MRERRRRTFPHPAKPMPAGEGNKRADGLQLTAEAYAGACLRSGPCAMSYTSVASPSHRETNDASRTANEKDAF
jgi:hypothetical protein